MNWDLDGMNGKSFDDFNGENTEPYEDEVIGGRYLLIHRVGQGELGDVWQARDLETYRDVALKFVIPPRLSRFNDEIRHLQRVFRKIRSLYHPNICPVYAFKNDPDYGYYLVMKWMEGDSLSVFARKYRNNPSFYTYLVPTILKKIASGLDYAHSQGIIHRNINPRNIFILSETDPENGKKRISGVKIVDFGLSEIWESLTAISRGALSQNIYRILPYMAPELIRGVNENAKTDQYSLAAVAYELYASYPPFNCRNIESFRYVITICSPEEIEDVSDDVNNALLKALAKDRADRFATCSKFIYPLLCDATFNPNDYEYTEAASGNGLCLTRYKGKDAVLYIPDQINGLPITEIKDRAFAVCRSITSITLPNSVRTIEYYPFIGSHSLRSITLPDSLNTLDINVFRGCDSLSSIKISERNTSFKSENGVLFSKNGESLIFYPRSKKDKIYNVPDSVTTIYPGAFANCKLLEKIILPSSVKSTPENAFIGCNAEVIHYH